MRQHALRLFFGVLLIGLVGRLTGQSQIVRGQVIDLETALPVRLASVSALEASLLTTTGRDGRYEIKTAKPFSKLRVEAVGYKTQLLDVRSGDSLQVLDVALEPVNFQIKEVTIKPKKYRNKDNPAVELIRLVVENRDKNRVRHLSTYQDEQYEKIVVGLGNVPKQVRDRRLLRKIRFIWDNVDTTKLADIRIVPLFVQENILDYYSRYPPPDQKKIITAIKAIPFKGFLDDEGIDKSLHYLYQGIDIYESTIPLLTNKFASPISDNAPLLYRYYPMDTIEEAGQKIVRLEFYPRNKYDMLLQGDLYIALDSTYPVTRIRFTTNPHANLNWVNTLVVEQEFERQPSGRRILTREDYRMYFGITKRGMGAFGQRFVEHRHLKIEQPLPSDTLFQGSLETITAPKAERSADTAFWRLNRVPINGAETTAYYNMDSLLRMPWFIMMSKLTRLAFGGFTDITPKFEIGPISQFAAFNGVEGFRARLSGRTTPLFSKRWNFGGQVTYGWKDLRWKIGANASYALPGTTYNRFPLSRLSVRFLQDVTLPGQNQYLNSTLSSSITSGPNDKFLYSEVFRLKYEREYRNYLSYNAGFERESLGPAGALRFEPVDGSAALNRPVAASRFFAEIRYAPGETYFQNPSGYRNEIAFKFITQLRYARTVKGLFGGNYAYDEVGIVLRKFTNVPPLGYNTFTLEAGGVFGKVPFPFLILHRANQSYIYQTNDYNLMNFMEFISDRYVALHVNQYFNGFFLNKVPLIKRLKLREVATVKVLYGMVSDNNKPDDNSGLFRFPTRPDGTPITYTLEQKPYVEASVGISNIFKIVRIDLVRRFNYLEHPGAQKFGIKGTLQVEF
ncbi:MAG: carboxypeptidase-like regulatory domain-containing protein [Saprospiraceae bacterium]|nr:carboxypeptidase-like regulatory domain-containing protein [Saprospiraceae bacterium]